MVHHTENTLQEVIISNHAITTNTTHSSENTFQTRHTLPLPQLTDVVAHQLREERRGDAFGCRWCLDCRKRALTREASTSKPRTLHVLPIQYICTSCSALPTSGYRTGASQALGRAPSDSNPAKQNTDWTNAADHVPSVTSTVQLYTSADE